MNEGLVGDAFGSSSVWIDHCGHVSDTDVTKIKYCPGLTTTRAREKDGREGAGTGMWGEQEGGRSAHSARTVTAEAEIHGRSFKGYPRERGNRSDDPCGVPPDELVLYSAMTESTSNVFLATTMRYLPRNFYKEA